VAEASQRPASRKHKGNPILANDELAAAIRQVRSGQEFQFALVAKSSDLQLAMDKRKIGGDEIARMKKTVGGGAVIRGTCTFEDGTLMFSAAKAPPGAMVVVLKKMIKEETGITVNCGFRIGAAAEDEEAESEDEAPASAKAAPAGPAPTPAAPGPAAPGPAALAKRPLMVEFADLVKANAATIKDQPEVAKLVRGIKAALDADKLEDAAKLIGALKRQTT
jgi:hypothetical protein